MNNIEKLNSLAAALPSPFKENAETLLEKMGTVIEGIGDEDVTWKAPMLRMIQGTTDRSSYPRGALIGDFVIGEEKIERPLKFIPLYVWEGRQYWSPDQNESKMLCSSPDAKLGYIGSYCNQCPHSKFDESARKSECGKIRQCLAITSDLSTIFAVSFAKTNYVTGTELVGMLKKAGVSPYRRVYELDSATNSEYKNVENFRVKPAPAAERNVPTEFLEFLTELFRSVQGERKESLETFYKITLERRERTPQLPTSAGEGESILLTGSSDDAAPISDMAKSYVV